MPQRAIDAMDNFRRSHDHRTKQLGQVIRRQLIIDIAVFRDQWCDALRVEDIHGDDDAATVALLEDVDISIQKLGYNPLLDKFISCLELVRASKHRQERTVDNLPAYAIGVFF